MHYLAATLHALGIQLLDTTGHKIEGRDGDRPGDRGSVTMEQVLWAVAVIAIVGIVVAAITAYVSSKAAQIT